MIGDPAGLTAVNVLRRAENMISSALRHGTTKHLKPHDEQVKHGLKWTNNEINNIGYLLEFSKDIVFNAVPNLKNITFNAENGLFYKNNKEISNEEIEEIISESSKAREAGIGLATAKRAIISHTALQELQQGELDSSILYAQRGRGVRILEPVLYSKNGKVQAFYNPKDDTTYFVYDNIDQSIDLTKLMLHEIGGVYALQLGKNNEEFQAILDEVGRLSKKQLKPRKIHILNLSFSLKR